MELNVDGRPEAVLRREKKRVRTVMVDLVESSFLYHSVGWCFSKGDERVVGIRAIGAPTCSLAFIKNESKNMLVPMWLTRECSSR